MTAQAGAQRAAPAARGAEAACLAVILIGAAVLRWRFLDVPLERDEGEYAYLGQIILRGELPYVAAQNMKLPGTYYAYAVILALLGETGRAVRLGLLAVNLISIGLIFAIGRRLVDSVTGLAAAACFAALSVAPAMLGFTANAEHFVVLPMLGGVLALAAPAERWRPSTLVIAGFLLGIGFLAKQHGAAFVVWGGVVVSFELVRRPERNWFASLAGVAVYAVAAALPFGVVCAGMWASGAFGRFWFWTFTYASEYAVNLIPIDKGMELLGRRVVSIGREAPLLWGLGIVGTSALGWDRRVRRRAFFVGSLSVFSFLAVIPGLRFTDHYFLLLVPAASLLAGVGVGALGRLAGASRADLGRAVALGTTITAVLASVFTQRQVLFGLSPVEVSRALYATDPFPEAIEIASELRRRAHPGDRVAVIGSEPEIYFHSGLPAGTTYIYTYPLMEAHPFAARMQEEMIEQIESAKPRFLVLVNVDNSWTRRPDSATRIFEWAEQTVERDYEPIGVAEIVPGAPTRYVWGEPARQVQPTSRAFVVTFERRS